MFDLPVALCLLASTKQLSTEHMERFLIAGELGLSGKIKINPGWARHGIIS